MGFHLNPTDYDPNDNPTRFNDDQPIDRLFYEGDPKFTLTSVRGGWRLGEFGVNPGMEIVVERIISRPKIELARTAVNTITVPALTSTDSSDIFRHWDAKEAILDFIDPCAFWGSFFVTKLSAWDATALEFDKLSGNEIYENVLRGAGSAQNFANRNKAYLDIRNEHNNSMNYYQADGPNIQLTLDPDADIDTCEVNYYRSGWPCFWVDDSALPAGATGDRVDVRFALPKTSNTRPIVYVSTGYRGKLGSLKDQDRFLDRERRPNTNYLYDSTITIPLVQNSTVPQIYPFYSKMHHFKRSVHSHGTAPPSGDPNALAPTRQYPLDLLMPLLSLEDLPVKPAGVVLRTYDEVIYVEAYLGRGIGSAAQPAIAADQNNVVLILVPKAYNTTLKKSNREPPRLAWPALGLGNGELSVFGYVSYFLPEHFSMVKVVDPHSTKQLELISRAASADDIRSIVKNSPRTIILGLSQSELSVVTSMTKANSVIFGLPFLSMEKVADLYDNLVRYNEYRVCLSVLTESPQVTRSKTWTSLFSYQHVHV